MIAGVSGRSFLKGMVAALLGALVGCIGLDPMSGGQRFVFGQTDLLGGIALVPILIGMFALSEIFIQAERKATHAVSAMAYKGEPPLSLRALLAVRWTILRSTGLGVFIGALPGIGSEIACWVAYGAAQRRSKARAEYGNGSLEGVAAAEAGNNASVPATLVPMLVFGIPGDTVTAVLLGAFMAQGLLPGPLLFQNSGDVIYGLFGILLLTNILLLGFGLVAISQFRAIVRVPQAILAPCVLVLCFAGAYSANQNMFDVGVLVAGGFLGYAMRKLDVPIPPFVIALLLGSGLENSLRQSLLFSPDGWLIFVQRPISAVLLGLLVAFIVFQIAMAIRRGIVRRRSTTNPQRVAK